jgi:hypothetical protein
MEPAPAPDTTDTNEMMEWCDEHLPELYHISMFDSEDVNEEVWDSVDALLAPLAGPMSEESHETLTEMIHQWFSTHHQLMLEHLLVPVEEAKLQLLIQQRQTPQHTAEWYSEKAHCLSASEFRDILTGSRGALLRKKLALLFGLDEGRSGGNTIGISQEDGTMNPTTWGHRFEPIIRAIYEEEISGTNTVLDNLGRFRHADPTRSWLRASPDGIVLRGPLAGRLVEIKAPKSRQPGQFVPDDYWVQMQVQAEVLDLEAVEFVEAQFQQRHTAEMTEVDKEACTSAKWKGTLQVVGVNPMDMATWHYEYTKPTEDELISPLPTQPPQETVLEHTTWWLTGFYPRTVLRDRDWWATVGCPAADRFWAELMEKQKEGPPKMDEREVTVEKEGWMGS